MSVQQGFSLYDAVRCAMNQRHQLEQMCRYITRPAIANERLQLNHAGDVVMQLKSPSCQGELALGKKYNNNNKI